MKQSKHKKYQITGNGRDYLKFSELRAKCKRLRKGCTRNFLAPVDNNLICNPKNFWKVINEKQTSNDIPINMDLIILQLLIVDLFEEHFSSVYLF